MKTYRFRLKSTNVPMLSAMAGDVNFVWNYCNDTAIQYLDKKDKWLSWFDLCKLTVGCSKSMSINSQTINLVCREYTIKRSSLKRRKLSWRSSKRSLPWIPFRKETVFVNGSSVTIRGNTFRFWLSRPIEGEIKTGSFTQDSQGHWFVSFQCSTIKTELIKSGGEVGVDLGLKTIATLSNGNCLSRVNLFNKYAYKLGVAQRSNHKKRVVRIHTKIKNARSDWNHKETTKLVNQFDRIIVGNVSPSKLKKTRMAKSVSDAGWADFKSMLAYKAIALGVEFKEVKENFSTVTCSTCFERTGPRGLGALGVREWICKCGATHDRDVNAAKNILRFGHESPIKGSPRRKVPNNGCGLSIPSIIPARSAPFKL